MQVKYFSPYHFKNVRITNLAKLPVKPNEVGDING